MNDRDLLQAYAREGSDSAFRELVQRHTALVFSCARQRLGDSHAAEDVTQSVFLALAIKAPQLPAETILAGWLYRATRFAAADYRRREQHRREREMKAHEQQEIQHSGEDPASLWREIEPHLHGALDELSDADRESVLLRYFQQSSYAQIGEVLSISEEAAKKRVSRAVERLRDLFSRRGVRLGTGVLAGALSTQAVEVVPAALAAQVAQNAVIAKAALTGAAGALAVKPAMLLAKGALTMFSWTSSKIAVTAGVCALAASGLYLTTRQNSDTVPDSVPARATGPVTAVGTTLPPRSIALPNQLAAPAMTDRLIPAALANSLQEALLIKDATQRRDQLRAIMAGLKAEDMPEAYAIVAGLLPFSRDMNAPLETEKATCAKCHSGDLPGQRGSPTKPSCPVFDYGLNPAAEALLFRWGQVDPAAALAKNIGTDSVLSGWAETDPQAATSYVRQNARPSTVAHRDLLQLTLGNWVRKDPSAAAAYLTTLPREDQARYAADIGRGWTSKDPAAATRWAAALTDPTARAQAYAAIAYAWGREQPEAAGVWLNSLPVGPDHDAALGMYSRILAGDSRPIAGSSTPLRGDPQAATQWASRITDESVRAKAYVQIAEAFTAKDPQAALGWLESLAVGSPRDQAAFSASMEAGQQHPAAAITWAELIQDETLRARAFGSIVHWWSFGPNGDRPAATAWVNKLPAGPARDAALAALARK